MNNQNNNFYYQHQGQWLPKQSLQVNQGGVPQQGIRNLQMAVPTGLPLSHALCQGSSSTLSQSATSSITSPVSMITRSPQNLRGPISNFTQHMNPEMLAYMNHLDNVKKLNVVQQAPRGSASAGIGILAAPIRPPPTIRGLPAAPKGMHALKQPQMTLAQKIVERNNQVQLMKNNTNSVQNNVLTNANHNYLPPNHQFQQRQQVKPTNIFKQIITIDDDDPLKINPKSDLISQNQNAISEPNQNTYKIKYE